MKLPRDPEYARTGFGECDSCHTESTLHGFTDDEPGEWGYCAPCADKIAARRWAKVRAWEAETGGRW